MAAPLSGAPLEPESSLAAVPSTVDVLLVDDRPEQLLALEAALTGLTVTLFKASSGREALRLLLRRDFALILLDVNMPGMDGFELAALIRGRSRSAQTPIIFITASDLDTHVTRGYSLGAVDYIHSPVVPEILRAKVNVFVELYRKTDEVRRRGEELRDLEAREHRRQLDEAMKNLAFEARQVEILREEQRHAQRAQKLADASVAVHAAHGVEEMLTAVAAQARGLLGSASAFVWIRDEGGTRVAWSRGPEPDADGVPVSAGFESLLAAAAGVNEALRLAGDGLAADSELGPAWQRIAPEQRPSRWISVPIAGGERPIGVLGACDGLESSAFAEEDEELLRSLAAIASGALQDRLFREAREANRIKDEFLAVLSHELRTPLSAMVGWTQLLRSGKLDERNAERAVEIIERNLKIQTQLIDDLLDMSRIITGKLRLEPAAIVLPPLVAGAVDALRPAAEAKGIRVESSLDDVAASVWGDGGRLEQVVWNLLSNAIKFTPAGGTIAVSLVRAGGTAELRVQDSGEGIEPEMLPLIFECFTQSKSVLPRTQGGLGLGLMIVRRLVELHGGSIQAQSAGKGRGACFTVRLPVFDAEPLGLVGTRNYEGTRTSLRGLRVLVVEDEADAREMLAVALGGAGARVRAVTSAAEAMAEFERETPDVLISDISMPGEDGVSLMRRVRSRPRNQGGAVPAIALTALAEHRDRLTTLEAGYQIHIAKPVDLKQLVLATAALAPAATREQERAGEAVS